MRRMRRHLTWIILLVLAPVSYLLSMLVVVAANEAASGAADVGSELGWRLLQLLMLVLAVVAPIVFLILSIVHMRRTYRRAQRARGRFTRGEQAQLERAQRSVDAWEHARAVRSTLLTRQVPGAISQWEIVPYADEVFFASVGLNYARYYGQDVSYEQTSTVAVGRPAFVVAALGVNALANAAARSRATTQAAPQWREWQQAPVYLTSRRIIVNVGGHWLSFDYSAMTAIFPEVVSATFICQFDTAEPLLLSGDDAALVAVFAVLQTHGVEGLRDHPALQALNQPAAAPELPPVGKTV